MEFHERLVELRKEKGFTREDFADYLGISKYTLRNYEMGKTEPGHVFLKYLSDIFHVSIDYLLCMTDDKTPPAKQSGFSAPEIEHIKKYRALDEHGKGHVDTVLQWESDRMAQLRQAAVSAPATATMQQKRVIQYYQRLASAGSGQVVFDGVPVEPLEIPDKPEYRRVSYAVGVNGHSMEPLYEDGDILLVEPTCQIDQGEIGIFIVGDKAYVKELGKTELLSVNTECANVPLTEDTKCMGRVVDKL